MLVPSNPNSLIQLHVDTQLCPNLIEDCDPKKKKKVFWLIAKVNIISTHCTTLHTHLQNH